MFICLFIYLFFLLSSSTTLQYPPIFPWPFLRTSLMIASKEIHSFAITARKFCPWVHVLELLFLYPSCHWQHWADHTDFPACFCQLLIVNIISLKASLRKENKPTSPLIVQKDVFILWTRNICSYVVVIQPYNYGNRKLQGPPSSTPNLPGVHNPPAVLCAEDAQLKITKSVDCGLRKGAKKRTR